jgi:hypothetical protein
MRTVFECERCSGRIANGVRVERCSFRSHAVTDRRASTTKAKSGCLLPAQAACDGRSVQRQRPSQFHRMAGRRRIQPPDPFRYSLPEVE